MEKNVTTLETSQRLKDAGFPQTTFMWETREVEGRPYKQSVGMWVDQKQFAYERKGDFIPKVVRDWFAAPTAQEIADELPVTTFIQKCAGSDGYHATAPTGPEEQTGDTMAEALALLWLKLKEGDR